MATFSQDELDGFPQANGEYSEAEMARLIEAAADPEKAEQLTSLLSGLYEADGQGEILDDFQSIALAVALGEARVVAAIDLLMKPALDFEMGVFGEAAKYALQRMAVSADAADEPPTIFDAAMKVAESDPSAWTRIHAYEILAAAESSRASLRQRIADFCVARVPIELATQWNEDWTPAISALSVLQFFRDDRARPLMEKAVADEHAFAHEFRSMLVYFEKGTDFDGRDWERPWQEMCAKWQDILDHRAPESEDAEEGTDESADDGADSNSEIYEAHQKLADEFAESEFAAGIAGISPDDAADQIKCIFNAGVEYFGLDARDLHVGDLHELLYDILPRKYSFEMKFFEQFPLVLLGFLKFLQAAGYLTDPTRQQQLFALAEQAKTKLPALAADPANWGMAKTMIMRGKEAGYDMSDPADMARFTLEYNASLNARNSRPAFDSDADEPMLSSPVTIRREGPKIGRNDPCPCGSGKKYKKCCGKEK